MASSRNKPEGSLSEAVDKCSAFKLDPFPTLENSLKIFHRKTHSSVPLQTLKILEPQIHKRKIKRKDPILVNVDAVIKELLVKPKTTKIVVKRLSPAVVCGNSLDSANPIRKRGKHRENVRKKLSTLKTGIIKERIMASMDKNQNLNDINFNNAIKEYLKNRNNQVSKKRDIPSENNKKNSKNPNQGTKVIKEGNVAIKKAFSRKFREYCENALTLNLDKVVEDFIVNIVKLQDRAFEKNAVKAEMRRRHVCGLHEITKYLKVKKIKLIVLPPDLERSDTLNSKIMEIKNEAAAQNVPCVFALSRGKLGHFTLKKVPVSGFGVFSYDGLNEQFQSILNELEHAREIFFELFPEKKTETDEKVVERLSALKLL